MTPAARVAAAATVLDAIFAGKTAEQALKAWGRASRFAGSKDRAALRDLVFDALRRRASCAVLGGGLNGRGMMLGLGIQQGWPLAEIFSGDGYGPAALTDEERLHVECPAELTGATALDAPEWIYTQMQSDLGDAAAPALQVLRDRADVFVRVNQRRTTVAKAIGQLSTDGLTAEPHQFVDGCLRLTANARRLAQSVAYQSGQVDIQDASSQRAVAELPIPPGATVLDYCAGGGGKALALADQFDCRVAAHDVSDLRMKDITPRAQRAGVEIEILHSDQLTQDRTFDVVIVDAPCSGSGTWRRNPEEKWSLTPEKLRDFSELQSNVLASAARHLKSGGLLVYMTCSIFSDENDDVIAAFCNARSDIRKTDRLSLLPTQDWDGFFCQQLQHIA